MSTSASDPRALRRAVPVDRYATILAHLLHFRDAPPSAVLERFGLDPATWEATDAAWRAELEEVVRRYRGDLAMTFASALARARSTLSREQPALERIGDHRPAPPAPPPQAAAPPPPAPPPEPASPPLVPTYQREERAVPAQAQASWQPPPVVVAPTPPVEDVAGTADVTSFVPRQPLPFAPSAAPAVPPPRASEPWTPPPGSGTEDITSFVAGAATPFSAGAPAAAKPRMRLVRFDPQTGQPLAEPRWEEIPPEKS